MLTGAGIVGLAVGFGAQTLVRDIISGFFLILENQVRVGDVAAINGHGGLVEAINLRTIVLRDIEGTVHVVPERRDHHAGQPQQGLLVLRDRPGDPVPRGYRSRHRRCCARSATELQTDDRFGPLDPRAARGPRRRRFGDWSVTLKLRIKTVPLKQWEVGRELRRRILKVFDEHGIEHPVPAPRERRPAG